MNLYFQLCSYSMILRVVAEVRASRAGVIVPEPGTHWCYISMNDFSLSQKQQHTNRAKYFVPLLPVTAEETSK